MRCLIFPGQGIEVEPRHESYQMSVLQALCKTYDTLGIQWDFVAGHSLGQYAALYACGLVSWDQLYDLVQVRSTLMAQITVASGMVACIGAVHDVIELAQKHNCYVANYNSSTQTVVSGRVEDLTSLIEVCKQVGIKAISLKVAGGFHSPLYKQAGEDFLTALPHIDSDTRLICNTTALPFTGASSLAEHIYKSVLWKQSIDYLQLQGVTEFVEISPQPVLSKMLIRDGIACEQIWI